MDGERVKGVRVKGKRATRRCLDTSPLARDYSATGDLFHFSFFIPAVPPRSGRHPFGMNGVLGREVKGVRVKGISANLCRSVAQIRNS